MQQRSSPQTKPKPAGSSPKPQTDSRAWAKPSHAPGTAEHYLEREELPWMLTEAEKSALKKEAKETRAFAQKAFAHLKPKAV